MSNCSLPPFYHKKKKMIKNKKAVGRWGFLGIWQQQDFGHHIVSRFSTSWSSFWNKMWAKIEGGGWKRRRHNQLDQTDRLTRLTAIIFFFLLAVYIFILFQTINNKINSFSFEIKIREKPLEEVDVALLYWMRNKRKKKRMWEGNGCWVR